MGLINKIGLFLIILSVIIFVSCYIVIIFQKIRLKGLTKEDSISNGNWHGGTFYANPSVIRGYVNDNKDVIKNFKTHNKAVVFLVKFNYYTNRNYSS